MSPGRLIRTLGAACLGGTLALAACGGEPPPAESRLIILGFDGMDPELARRWMDEGLLPHFSRLADEGHFQPLATSNPPQSPVAWSSFATGESPGHHGIFDFLRRKPGSYIPSFSISESQPPEWNIEMFGWRIPLDGGRTVNRRQGTPFWEETEARGQRTTVLRVPVTYPPDDITRMFAGMGVPDLLGTQGTYTFYTTGRTGDSGNSSRVIRVRPRRDGSVHTTFEGPPHPLKPEADPLELDLVLAPGDAGMEISFGEHELTLPEGEWSEWLPIEFDFSGPGAAHGVVRMYLVQDFPRPRLYVSPIQIDPRQPAVPLSTPPDYAAKLADDMGYYHTIGMPEETWSLNEGHMPDDAWLDMEETILGERETMFFDALERNDSEVVVGVFVQTDRVSHMFYRGLDEHHPLHSETSERGRNAIRWIYQEADRILGRTLENMDPDDRLMVISDHGFAPYRWSVHLNRWLIDNGYMQLEEGRDEAGSVFSGVDWANTQAYALGLNGIFLNLEGRESQGSVDPSRAEALKEEIVDRLQAWRDPSPNRDRSVVRRVFDGAREYQGPNTGDAPELVVGYAPGYRASWQTTLGGAPAALVESNRQKWSGDHCIDPAVVPGVLFTSFEPDRPIEGIGDLADYVLSVDSKDR